MIVSATVKEADPESKIQKGKVIRAVVVRTRKELRRTAHEQDVDPRGTGQGQGQSQSYPQEERKSFGSSRSQYEDDFVPEDDVPM